MLKVAELWNPKQALLKTLLQNTTEFEKAKELALEMHSMVHGSHMSKTKLRTFEDELWDELDGEAFSRMLTIKDVTIAWNLWHITRIEDLTANILIADEVQVLNSGNWLERMNVKVTDTGNAMSDDEIISLSTTINMDELRNYRIAVGRKTRDIIKSLKPEDIKRKVAPSGIQRILGEGGVLDVEGSIWLLDFWSKKTVSGILTMPLTRHQIVHINDSLKIKERFLKQSRK